MSAEQAGRVLIASNRGPVSFSLGDDGRLTSQRGGGGVATALSALAGRAEVLWVCAALNDADRAAARAAADGLLDMPLGAGDAAAGGPESVVRMLDIPAPVFDRAYNGVANSTLWFLHHLLFDTPNQPLFGLAFRREWESFRAYNAAFADALAEGAGHGHPRHGAGLPPDSGPPDARTAPPRPGDRALLTHPVGAKHGLAAVQERAGPALRVKPGMVGAEYALENLARHVVGQQCEVIRRRPRGV